MALAANSNLDTSSAPAQDETQSFIVSNSAVVFAGAYMGILSGTGHVSGISDTAGMLPAGFAMDEATGDTTATPPVEVPLNIGGITVRDQVVTGLSAASQIGESVFVTDNNTFTLSATTNIQEVGMVVRHITGTTGDVRFFSLADNENRRNTS